MITLGVLNALGGIRHGFFTRQGGVSAGPYAGLNCGPGSDDRPEAVTANRARVAKRLGVPPANLLTLWQEHGTRAVTVRKPYPHDHRPVADALVTDRPGLALGILTADCAPVLFADAEAGIIGAAHAGWKGAKAGILEATIEAMLALGATRQNIHAAIGPRIGPASYEVDPPFRDGFLTDEPGVEEFFRPATTPAKWLFDLGGYVARRLSGQTLAGIGTAEDDTLVDERRFFSYRRSCQRGEPDYGRQISVILLTG